jgi:hypothetical protein
VPDVAGAPGPTEFVAVTVTVYGVPLLRPGMLQAVPVVVQLALPGEAAAV